MSVQSGKIDYREVLPAEQFEVFARLRTLRKALAERDAVPVFTVFTNAQLAEMVRMPLRTAADLAKIDGVGEARVTKYGNQNNNGRNCRSANRNRNTPDNRNQNNGFRLAAAPAGRGWMSRPAGTGPDPAPVARAAGRTRKRRRPLVGRDGWMPGPKAAGGAMGLGSGNAAAVDPVTGLLFPGCWQTDHPRAGFRQ